MHAYAAFFQENSISNHNNLSVKELCYFFSVCSYAVYAHLCISGSADGVAVDRTTSQCNKVELDCQGAVWLKAAIINACSVEKDRPRPGKSAFPIQPSAPRVRRRRRAYFADARSP